MVEERVRGEKNATGALVFLLLLMGGFLVYQFVYLPYVNKEEAPPEEKKEEKTEAEILAELSEYLFNAFTLTLEEESVYMPDDLEGLSEKLSLYRMSDELKIYYAIKNINEGETTRDAAYNRRVALENANGDYVYDGYYIMAKYVDVKLKELFGEIPYTHRTITLDDTMYVYKASKGIYEIWANKNEVEAKEEKIVHHEVVTTSREIIIYQYVAYTNSTDPENITSRTFHYPSIGIIITEENIKDYLSYTDKFKYTFDKASDGNYYFSSLEYIKE